MTQNKIYPIFAGHTPIVGTYNFTQEQVSKLCQMQDTLNSYIHPEWKDQGFNWILAIQDEIMETHGHLGWKWWKGNYNVGLTAENLRQVQLEVIDILHFVLSWELETSTLSNIFRDINACVSDEAEQLNKLLSYINYQAIDEGYCIVEAWADLARFVGLTEQDVMETYIQKYVLNKFRQDHGYKTGEYEKEWVREIVAEGGERTVVREEDNEVLQLIVYQINTFECQDSSDEQLLYNRLELFYNSRLNQ